MENSIPDQLSHSPVDYALAYARRGWLVFPLHSCSEHVCSCGHNDCSSQGKHPRTKNGVKDATTDPALIRRWWTTWPDANIGVATGKISGLYVIDVDCYKGGDFDILKDYGLDDLLCSLIAETGSKGYHIYLACTEPLPNTTNKLGPCIDTRGEGGYVVAPPSRNAQGQYIWANKAQLLPLPLELLNKLREHTPASFPPHSIPSTPLLVPDSEMVPDTPTPGAIPLTPPLPSTRARKASPVAQEARNAFLASISGTLLGRGITPEQVRPMLLALNEARYGQGAHPRGALALNELERTIFKSLEKWQVGKADLTPASVELKMLKSLMEKELPPIRWAVPGLLPEGLALLVGDPKAGKSFLMVGLALAVAGDSLVLGKITVDLQLVLYLGLEDGERRLQDRINTVLDGRPVPDLFAYELEWDMLSQGGLDRLRAYLEAYPDIRMVVVDTLAKVRSPQASGGNIYLEEYRMISSLQTLAMKYHIALVVVHHTNKKGGADPFSEASGTRGLTGAADTLLVLKREPNSRQGTLHITGRDVAWQELALTFQKENCTWLLTGSAEERRNNYTHQEILDLLEEKGTMGPSEISMMLKKPGGTIRKALYRLLQDGLVTKGERGSYQLADLSRVRQQEATLFSSSPPISQAEMEKANL